MHKYLDFLSFSFPPFFLFFFFVKNDLLDRHWTMISRQSLFLTRTDSEHRGRDRDRYERVADFFRASKRILCTSSTKNNSRRVPASEYCGRRKPKAPSFVSKKFSVTRSVYLPFLGSNKRNSGDTARGRVFVYATRRAREGKKRKRKKEMESR